MRKNLWIVAFFFISIIISLTITNIGESEKTTTEMFNNRWDMYLPEECDDIYSITEYSFTGDGLRYTIVLFDKPVLDYIRMNVSNDLIAKECNDYLLYLEKNTKKKVRTKYWPDFTLGYYLKKGLGDGSQVIFFTEDSKSRMLYVIELIV